MAVNRNEYMREYHAANHDRLAERQREYRRDPENRDRRNRLRRERYANDPEYRERHKAGVRANPAAKREAKLRRLYGIGAAEFDAILARQGGACAICRTAALDVRGYQLHVDHCHDTGMIRGILCGGCNRGIGLFRDDPQLLQRAINYLSRYKEGPIHD